MLLDPLSKVHKAPANLTTKLPLEMLSVTFFVPTCYASRPSFRTEPLATPCSSRCLLKADICPSIAFSRALPSRLGPGLSSPPFGCCSDTPRHPCVSYKVFRGPGSPVPAPHPAKTRKRWEVPLVRPLIWKTGRSLASVHPSSRQTPLDAADPSPPRCRDTHASPPRTRVGQWYRPYRDQSS